MHHKTVFCGFLWKYSFFRKNCRIKNIQSQIFNKKGYIHFWCKMTPDRSHSDTVGHVANKVRSQVSLFWRTSCARDFLNRTYHGWWWLQMSFNQNNNAYLEEFGVLSKNDITSTYFLAPFFFLFFCSTRLYSSILFLLFFVFIALVISWRYFNLRTFQYGRNSRV